jgi:hypothetical protein
MLKFVDFGGSAGFIQPVGKEAVTLSSSFPPGIVR